MCILPNDPKTLLYTEVSSLVSNTSFNILWPAVGSQCTAHCNIAVRRSHNFSAAKLQISSACQIMDWNSVKPDKQINLETAPNSDNGQMTGSRLRRIRK